MRRVAKVVGLVAFGLWVSIGDAAEPPHTEQRAGYPNRIAWYAIPAPNMKYRSGYVGGGTLWRGEPRYASEGTWGMDYRGRIIPKKTFLLWSHGRRYQGGTGSYNPDKGPVVPVPRILRDF